MCSRGYVCHWCACVPFCVYRCSGCAVVASVFRFQVSLSPHSHCVSNVLCNTYVCHSIDAAKSQLTMAAALKQTLDDVTATIKKSEEALTKKINDATKADDSTYARCICRHWPSAGATVRVSTVVHPTLLQMCTCAHMCMCVCVCVCVCVCIWIWCVL